MATLVSVVTDAVRRLMGDDDTAVYTDATLLPGAGQGPINQAYRYVQHQLVNRGCSVLRETSSVLAVPAGLTSITSISSPALPADIIVPYKLWERTTGSTSNADWMLMTRGDELPDRVQYSYLGDWRFEGGNIDLVGATVGCDVRISYERLLTPFSATTDPVGILGAEDAIAFYTAALMAMSRGQSTMAQYFEKKCADALDELETRFTHSNQAVHGRRRLAYGRRATGRH
jgi:hypothetical protein